MIVVDSSVWINFFRRQQTAAVAKLKALEETERILVGDFVLFEILQGARSEAHAADLQRYMRRFPCTEMLSIDMAVKAARNYRVLRSHGVTLRKWADLVIGTFAIERGYSLLHEDRDYDLMQQHLGLRVY